jgi:hypothetical protein
MRAVYWFVLFSVIGISIYLAERNGFSLPELVRFYLNDLLIVPLTALITRWLMRVLFHVGNFILSVGQVVFIVLFYSLLFELILPLYIQRYTGDFLDVVMYAAGGAFYWKFINKA